MIVYSTHAIFEFNKSPVYSVDNLTLYWDWVGHLFFLTNNYLVRFPALYSVKLIFTSFNHNILQGQALILYSAEDLRQVMILPLA